MIYDLAILGGGPAGTAAGVYAARKRLKTVFITKDWNGQSTVSEGIENWIGEIKISGMDLSKKLETHLKAYAKGIINIKEGELAVELKKTTGKTSDKTANSFKITSDKNSYEAKTVLITTGSSRRKLEIPGAKEYDNKGIVYCASCDGPLYSDQDVAIIGGGNAAFETAAQLLAYCKSVTMLVRSDFKADQVTIDKVLKHPKMTAIKGVIPKEVKGEKFVTGLIYSDKNTGKDITLPVTGIFVEIGSIPNTDFTKNIVDLDPYNHIITNPKNQRSSIEGIWAAGDCTDGLYHQNNIAAGDAVKAVEDIYLHLHAR
ncbi:MAG: FAD-dependent oxidoreductase [Candidatus Taylorbacteria bacterium]|nr:FAD-dependent oxidoreductase [Candidatus Taylorbacteria bacterium]